MSSTREHILALEAQRQTERFYIEWRARRDQLQSEYDAEVKNEEYTTSKAIAAVEAEFHRNMQVAAANGPQTVAMVEEVMVTRKDLKIKDLENRLRETRAKLQVHYEKQLLDHTAKFSDAIMDKLKPLGAYTTHQVASSPSRHPASPVVPSNIPPYPRQPLGSNTDSRLPIHDQNRQHPQPGAAPLRGGEYNAYTSQPRGFQERDYGRQPGQSRLSSEHQTSIGAERHQPRWIYPPSQPQADLNNTPGDGRPRHLLPSQQRILPSTPMAGEPQRVIDPLNTMGSAKRRSDALGDSHAEQGLPKRTRSGGVPSDRMQASPSDKPKIHAEGDKANPSTPRPTTKTPAVKRTIDFNEVYQDGDAEYKHIIFMYPPGDSGGDWYILKCDEHGVHFNTNPLLGAAKHLHSAQHNNLSKEHSLAIRELGHLVWDCTKELAEKNNDAVKKAFDNGYKPFNRNQLSKTERKSMGFAVPETIPARRTHGPWRDGPGNVASNSTASGGSKEFAAVAYPVDGELYLGYWSKNKTRYAVMLLPWGDLEPYTGIQGTLLGTGLLEKPPKCYTIDRVTHEITGWAEGYEDGGRLVNKREFPVMYFDNPQKCSVGWVRAKDLTRFNFDDPNWRLIPYYDDARDRYASAQPQKFASYEQMIHYYEANGLHLKLLSDVRDPPASERTPGTSGAQPTADDGPAASAGNGNGGVMNGDKSPQPDTPAGENGHGEAVEIEMRDASRDDEMDSDEDSEPSDVPDSDEDVEMGNAESRRTSVSNKGPGRDESSLAATLGNADKKMADLPATNSDQPATVAQVNAVTAARASPGTDQPVEKVAQDGDKNMDVEAALEQTTEDAPKALRDAAGFVPRGSSTAASARSEPGSGSSKGSDGRLASEVEDHAHGTGSARTRGSPAQAHPTGTTIDGRVLGSPSAPRTKELIVHKGLAPEKETSTSGQDSHRGPDGDVAAKSSLTSVLQADARAEAASPASANVGSPKNQQTAGSAKATPVPVVAPSKSKKSDSSSSVSSARSISPTPVVAAASHPSSRTSTPTAVRPDEAALPNRWRAVRSESASQGLLSPPKQQPSEAVSATHSVTPASKELTAKEPTTKEPTAAAPATQGTTAKETSAPAAITVATSTPISRTSTPLPSKTGVEELFELAYYEDDLGGKFQKQKDGPFLRMVVDKVKNTCETAAGQRVEMKLNPYDIARVQVDPLDDSHRAACMVSLELKEGAEGPKKQQLVFETSKAMGREETGRIHARRFCGWVKRVNAGIDYRNNTFNSSRPATGYTRA